MALSGPHQRFLIIEQGAVPTVFNFALDGAIAWALFRTAEGVPLWGESSLGVDLLATAFLLPFLTCLIVSAIVARHVRDGKVPRLSADQLPNTQWHERSSMKRGLALGSAQAPQRFLGRDHIDVSQRLADEVGERARRMRRSHARNLTGSVG